MSRLYPLLPPRSCFLVILHHNGHLPLPTRCQCHHHRHHILLRARGFPTTRSVYRPLLSLDWIYRFRLPHSLKHDFYRILRRALGSSHASFRSVNYLVTSIAALASSLEFANHELVSRVLANFIMFPSCGLRHARLPFRHRDQHRSEISSVTLSLRGIVWLLSIFSGDVEMLASEPKSRGLPLDQRFHGE